MAKEIKLSELKEFIEMGKKREDIMEIYDLKSAQVTRLMKEANLSFKKLHHPVFKLVDDTIKTTETEEVQANEELAPESQEVLETQTENRNWGL